MKQKISGLFLKNFHQLTENEIYILELINKSLSNGKFIFLGPNLKLELMVKKILNEENRIRRVLLFPFP